MKRAHRGNIGSRLRSDSGQTIVFVVLALGIFLLGAVGFAVDIAHLWFHRQATQNAADAACTAAAMDMLFDAESITPPASETNWGNFKSGTDFDCAGTPTAGPCKYATLNGIDLKNSSNKVSFTFSNTFTGLKSCNTIPPPDVCEPSFLPFPVVTVKVGEAVPVVFAGLATGSSTMYSSAQAVCGVVAAQSPVPLLVLDPITNSLHENGTPSISIWGGPSKSVQVNSSDPAAVALIGSATINLSQGGPTLSGSEMGVFGGPTTAPGGFIPGATGTWVSPASPISDPFATLAAPSKPALAPAQKVVPYDPTGSLGTGCPDTGGCDEFAGGDYPGGIQVKNGRTAIFDPGLYYVEAPGLQLLANSTVRPSAAFGDGNGGTTFYFAGSASITVWANSGKNIIPFNTTTGTGSLANGLKCTAGSAIPANLPNPLLVGNMLLAPCTGPYGDPLEALGLTDPSGRQRGMLFFQDRSAQNVNSSWGGGGKFALVGSMYFHSCNAAGTGVGCGAAGTYYTDWFGFGGNSGSGSYVLGDIITDNLDLHGTPGITMDLNPSAAYWILKASLLQ